MLTLWCGCYDVARLTEDKMWVQTGTRCSTRTHEDMRMTGIKKMAGALCGRCR